MIVMILIRNAIELNLVGTHAVIVAASPSTGSGNSSHEANTSCQNAGDKQVASDELTAIDHRQCSRSSPLSFWLGTDWQKSRGPVLGCPVQWPVRRLPART